MAKNNNTNIKALLERVHRVTKEKKLDLSSDEDLSVAIMNLISIEEHLFFTSQKTGKPQYLKLLNQVREMRKELLKKIVKDYEGEVWCISKHLLSASMRLMEVGTKELGKGLPAQAGNKKEAWSLFEKAYNLYSLFWGINLKIIKMPNAKFPMTNENIAFINEKGQEKSNASVFSKLGALVQKAIDCCRE